MKLPGARVGFLVMSAACVAAVGAAYWTQHHLDMQPCPWCILQRVQLLVLAGLGLLIAVLPSRLLQRVLSVLVVALAMSGVAAALWQHFVAAKSNSCALTLADRILTWTGLDQRWPELFEVRATCADAAVNLLNVPYEFWSLALFALVGVWALTSAMRRQ
jgi:protein dithiol:quinone oxidoreductase